MLTRRCGSMLVVLMLVLTCAAPAFGGCKSDLELSYTEDGNVLVVTLTNPTSSPQTGYVFVSVEVGGKAYQFWIPVTMPAYTTRIVEISADDTIKVVELYVCDKPPYGASSETPDPISVRVR